jgi:hypothetical protein
MPQDSFVIGLAPALAVEQQLHFGPFELTPVHMHESRELQQLAMRFAEERGAHASNQVVVTCQNDAQPLVTSLWPLFVFACVSHARLHRHRHGLKFPEQFHLLAARHEQHGFVFQTGHSSGIGAVRHVPLRWPVDEYGYLTSNAWDQRIELACALFRQCPEAVLRAAGAAADLATAAMEVRTQMVENLAGDARACILLASAFEALHAKGATSHHNRREVCMACSRLCRADGRDWPRLFASSCLGWTPATSPGNEVTLPSLAVAYLFSLRNVFAHGRTPSADEFVFPQALNGTSVFHACTLILGALLSDDLLGAIGCIPTGDYSEIDILTNRFGVPFDVLHSTYSGGMQLRTRIAALIDPEHSEEHDEL